MINMRMNKPDQLRRRVLLTSVSEVTQCSVLFSGDSPSGLSP